MSCPACDNPDHARVAAKDGYDIHRASLELLFRRSGFSRVKFRFGFKPTLKVIASP